MAETSHRPTDALLSSLYFFVAVQFCFYQGLPSRSFFVLSLSLFSLIMVIRFSFALFNCRNFCFCWCCCCVYVCVIDNDGLDLLTRDAAAVVVVANGVGQSRRSTMSGDVSSSSAYLVQEAQTSFYSQVSKPSFLCVCARVCMCVCAVRLCVQQWPEEPSHTHIRTQYTTHN